MAVPRLEGLLTVPASTTFTVDALAASTMTVQDAYLESVANGGSTTLRANFETLLIAKVAASTVAISATTGKTTITFGSGTHTITWGSATLRDVLGFTGTLTPAAASFVSPNACKALLLPGVQTTDLTSSLASTAGARRTDLRTNVARSGAVWTTQYNTRRFQRLRFLHMLKAKTWTAEEATTNESAESFFAYVLGPGAPFRYYKDNAALATFQTLVSQGPEFAPERTQESNDVLWAWELECADYVHAVAGAGVWA